MKQNYDLLRSAVRDKCSQIGLEDSDRLQANGTLLLINIPIKQINT